MLQTISASSVDRGFDVVFPLIHGAVGEDGCVQGFLRLLNVPFVGIGVIGSAIGMDKDVMKRLLNHAGISTAKFHVITRCNVQRPSFSELQHELGDSLFIKPANTGSSVGISKATNAAEFTRALQEAFRFDEKVLVEEAIHGRELECGVIGNEINTIPGFTNISMFPLLWEASGLSYPELIDRLVTLALQRHAALSKLSYDVRTNAPTAELAE